MKFKVAVVQFKIQQYLPEKNLHKAEAFVKKAKAKKADVVVFPEDFITGPVMRKKQFVDFKQEYAKYFQRLAKKYRVDIVCSSIIEGTRQGWYNAAYYVDSLGRILGKYRKSHLWIPEQAYLSSGRRACVFNTRFGKAGLIICWDLAFPEIFKQMAMKDVRIVYCPSFWSEDVPLALKYNPLTENEEKTISNI